MKNRNLVAALVLLCAATRAESQQGERCDFVNTPQTRSISIRLPSSEYNTFIGGGVYVRCPTKNLTLRSDSLESYGDEGRVYLVGRVQYDEPRLSLTSDYLTYYQRDERILASGSVFARLPNGSTLRGPIAEYFRAVPGIRPASRLVAGGRPIITVVQRDTVGQPAQPTTVVGHTVIMVGDSLIFASGSVVVTREDVIARGDSMHLDSEREITTMLRGPVIEGRRDRPFTLSGDRIDLTGRDRKLERVLSTSRARAVSEDMTLTSDTIDLRFSDDLLQRAVAWGPSRARAFSATQTIVADSIDVVMPGQRLREMYAVRSAAAEARPDTMRFEADTVDWLRGDTIIARFDTVPPPDTARSEQSAELRELIARGEARSYHHLPPADTALRRPAINYVRGREIVVAFEDQQVTRVTVYDQLGGVYLEPTARTSNQGTPARNSQRRSGSAATPTRSRP